MTSLLTGCVDLFSGRRPINYPNTRWVSQDPDMFFIVGEGKKVTDWSEAILAEVIYAQITIDGEVNEVFLGFDETGAGMFVYDLSVYDPETGWFIEGGLNLDAKLFSGLCKFSPNRLIVTITRNDKGFLDDSITEIIFIREDIVD